MTEKKQISGYGSMWLFAMFDLPVDTDDARREYTRFRKKLLNNGFLMLQFSVYARFCESEEASETYRNRIKGVLPPDGQVRIVAITDKQFARMDVFYGKRRTDVECPPEQLMLF